MFGLDAFIAWEKDFIIFLEFTELKDEKPLNEK